ncbi:MAG: PmoA family protein [Pirellulaceae bacterium]
MRRSLVLLFVLMVLGLVVPAQAENIAVKKIEGGVVVTAGDKPFATYVFQSGVKPIVWPILGPTGKEMTRAWPMREGNPDEKTDHVHQRSFWFTHGEVNGIDFWAETAKVQGKIEHKELVAAEGGPQGTIITRNAWIGPQDEHVLSDERTLRFGSDGETRWIDFDITLTAVADEVKFGDTKEGTFGLRIAESMRTDRKPAGKIVTSEGLENEKAWGQPASWVDYHGQVEGEHLGIAILNHPSSFRYPTGWHVRTYGLFAANPFGEGDFRGEKVETAHTLKKGERLALRYRVLLHKGDEKQGQVAEAFAKYAK